MMKKFLVFFCTMSLVFGIVGMGNASIINTDVWNSGGGNGHTYHVVGFANQSWDEATTNMNDLLGSGFHLATVTGQDEQDFVANLLGDLGGERR